MKKQILSILLALCTVLSVLPTTAFTSQTVSSGACGENLAWTLDSDGLPRACVGK